MYKVNLQGLCRAGVPLVSSLNQFPHSSVFLLWDLLMWVEMTSLTCPSPKIYTADNGCYSSTWHSRLKIPKALSSVLPPVQSISGKDIDLINYPFAAAMCWKFLGWPLDHGIAAAWELSMARRALAWASSGPLCQEGEMVDLVNPWHSLQPCALSPKCCFSPAMPRKLPMLWDCWAGGEPGDVSWDASAMPCCHHGPPRLVWCSPSSFSLNFC